ncbi:glycosyl transferase [Acanthocystis turfacea Chlorella virus Can0610SP]|nr:glycosyl transferase [Acanthocystis turfacea Chlorella virus Can0610SP]
MKILFASTSTTQTTGYGRISYNVIVYLASLGHEIHHFAFQRIQAYGIDNERVLPKNVHVIDVHTLSKDTFGTDIWVDTINTTKPDVIIIYNDMPVTCGLINKMLNLPKPCPLISYLDIVYTFQKTELIEHVVRHSDHIFVFSDFWKKHLMEHIGISCKNISVFPHGVDTNKFKKVDKKVAKRLIGVGDDDFVIFNTNRNSYRKLLDITLKAFVRFWKLTNNDKKVKLVINCRLDIDTGYNFQDIIKAACLIEKVDYEEISTKNILLLSRDMGGIVTDDFINTALNASDIGMNTCGGEGFGLCNAEGAFLGVPQIVTKTGGLSDIFKDFDNMLVDPKVFMTLPSSIDFHNGELAICDYKDFSDKLFFYYTNRDVLKKEGCEVEKHIKKQYDWDTLLEKFSYDLDSILKNNITSTCFYINRDEDIDNRMKMEKQKINGMNILRIKGDYNEKESHSKAIKRAFEENFTFAILCRDDVIFPSDFMTKLLHIISKLPLSWQKLQLRFKSNETITEGNIANPVCYILSKSGLFTIENKRTDITQSFISGLK